MSLWGGLSVWGLWLGLCRVCGWIVGRDCGYGIGGGPGHTPAPPLPPGTQPSPMVAAAAPQGAHDPLQAEPLGGARRCQSLGDWGICIPLLCFPPLHNSEEPPLTHAKLCCSGLTGFGWHTNSPMYRKM